MRHQTFFRNHCEGSSANNCGKWISEKYWKTVSVLKPNEACENESIVSLDLTLFDFNIKRFENIQSRVGEWEFSLFC